MLAALEEDPKECWTKIIKPNLTVNTSDMRKVGETENQVTLAERGTDWTI